MESVEIIKLLDSPGQRVGSATATATVQLKTYKIRWRINKISSIPDECNISGTIVTPFPDNPFSISMIKSKYYTIISLQLSKQNTNDSLRCKCETSILNSNGDKLYSHTREEVLLKNENKVSLVEEHLKLNELLERCTDDALIIECAVEIKMYKITVKLAKTAANCVPEFFRAMKKSTFEAGIVLAAAAALALIITLVLGSTPARLVLVRKQNGVIAKTNLDIPLPKELCTGESGMFRDGDRYVNKYSEEDRIPMHKDSGQANSDMENDHKLYRDADIAQVLKNFAAAILSEMKTQNSGHEMDWAAKYIGGDLNHTAIHYMDEYLDDNFTSPSWKTFLRNHTRLASEIGQLREMARMRKDSDGPLKKERILYFMFAVSIILLVIQVKLCLF